ncbi:MAG: deoxycytidylate deaminase [Thermoplasmatota archaeon]
MDDKDACLPSGDQFYSIEFDQSQPPKRQSWDVYFMNIARQVATRGTCHRKHVGCVIVRDRTILATGYNGSVRGMPHCDEVGHMMENGHCTRTAHAEQNAIAQAARYGVSVMEGEVYVTASPCWICFKIMANAGIKRIVFGEFYRDDRIFEAADHIGLELALLDSNNELKVFVKGK